MDNLKGQRLFITGGSRGIGLAIALRAARDGAQVAVAAKTADPHPKLPGTVYTAAEAIVAAGGEALPIVCDIRDEAQVAAAVEQTVDAFGGIDIVVNNASAIQLTGTAQTTMKRYDLMHQINARGTFVTTQACLPHLKKGNNPHVLTLSPPLDMDPKWFSPHAAYTVAKFGMSLYTLGWAEEFRRFGIAANALWPRTTIATAAVNMLGGDALMQKSRTPEIMADAAHAIFCKDSRAYTGNFCIDDLVLEEAGVTDFAPYRVDSAASESDLLPDYFVSDEVRKLGE